MVILVVVLSNGLRGIFQSTIKNGSLPRNHRALPQRAWRYRVSVCSVILWVSLRPGRDSFRRISARAESHAGRGQFSAMAQRHAQRCGLTATGADGAVDEDPYRAAAQL